MLSASTLNVTKLRIVSDATSRLVLAHMDAQALLKKHPFLPIDDTPQERSFGWCAWGDLTDTEWNAATPDIGGTYLARWRYGMGLAEDLREAAQ